MSKQTDLPIGRSADRRETVSAFRTRLETAMERVGINQSGLARAIGVDRSTLSQLLSRSVDRLPRADTVASMAIALQVSTDWLLGLVEDEGQGASILQESIEIAPSETSDVSNELLERWHADAMGYKIRYVPSSLPDLVKSDDVLAYEYGTYRAKSADAMKSTARRRLELSRLPEMEMEICCSKQLLEGFARAEWIWQGLDATSRDGQLASMSEIFHELYPRVRMFLFDGLEMYSIPYTVFGPRRAAIFLGQMYFVFNTREHIRTLSDHFDSLVRAAEIQAHEVPQFITDLRKHTR